jgi:hypothetical protein
MEHSILPDQVQVIIAAGHFGPVILFQTVRGALLLWRTHGFQCAAFLPASAAIPPSFMPPPNPKTWILVNKKIYQTLNFVEFGQHKMGHGCNLVCKNGLFFCCRLCQTDRD